MRKLLCLVVLLSGCTKQLSKVDYAYEKAHAAVTLAKCHLGVPDAKPSPKPEPGPQPGGKCANCGGDGNLGDTVVVVPCPICGGDGITQATSQPHSYWASNGDLFQHVSYIDPPKDEPPKRSEQDSEDNNPDVVVYTESWCEPCTRWKLNVMPKLLDDGKKVLLRKSVEGMRIPHFRFYRNNGVVEHNGFLTYEESKQALDGPR
jgi:hypothetical protein